jgi:cell division protein FtsB
LEAIMIQDKNRKVLPFTQILLILMGIFVAYLVVNFGRQVGVSHQRRQELQQVEDQITAARQERAELEQQLDHAESDAAVREWALPNGLIKPDEVRVVIPSLEPVPAAEQDSEAGAGPDSPRETWWDLFFGTR